MEHEVAVPFFIAHFRIKPKGLPAAGVAGDGLSKIDDKRQINGCKNIFNKNDIFILIFPYA